MSEQARQAERKLHEEAFPSEDIIRRLEDRVAELEGQIVVWKGKSSAQNKIQADLERQLAEAKAVLSDLPDHSDVDAAVFEANALRGQLDKAQGKLDAVEEWSNGVKSASYTPRGAAEFRALACILKEE